MCPSLTRKKRPGRKTAGLARQLIENSCGKPKIVPGQLTIHADQGSSMTSNHRPCCSQIGVLSGLTAAACF